MGIAHRQYSLCDQVHGFIISADWVATPGWSSPLLSIVHDVA